jgi:hypothetical protein
MGGCSASSCSRLLLHGIAVLFHHLMQQRHRPIQQAVPEQLYPVLGAAEARRHLLHAGHGDQR